MVKDQGLLLWELAIRTHWAQIKLRLIDAAKCKPQDPGIKIHKKVSAKTRILFNN